MARCLLVPILCIDLVYYEELGHDTTLSGTTVKQGSEGSETRLILTAVKATWIGGVADTYMN